MSNSSGEFKLRAYKGEMWALLSALSYALSTLFLRVAVRDYELNYLLGAVLRATPTFLFTLMVGLRMGRRDPTSRSPFSDWRPLVMLLAYGALTFVIGNPMYFAALRAGGVLIATPVVGTMAFWSALLAAIFLSQPLNWKMVASILVTVGGITLLARGQVGNVTVSPDWWIAIPLALGTALCWSSSGALITATMGRGVDRFRALAVATGSGILFLNIYFLLSGNLTVYADTPLWVYGAVLSGGVLNAVALVSVTTALSLTSVASATTVNSLQIGLAPLMAWLFLGEDLSWLMALGIVIIVVGVIVFQRARLGAA